MAQRLTRKKIPPPVIEWLISCRQQFFEERLAGRPLRYLSAHLPVLATWEEGNPFPVNMTVKGIGLIPKTSLLQKYTDLFENTLTEIDGISWKRSFSRRVSAASKLYNSMENFEPTLLGGLEIFEGKAFQNLKKNPFASLFFVGMSQNPEGVQYTSFQINGRVEILAEDNMHYKFLLSSRKLFEYDEFHLQQPGYPWGYLIKVQEVWEKSPWVRNG